MRMLFLMMMGWENIKLQFAEEDRIALFLDVQGTWRKERKK